MINALYRAQGIGNAPAGMDRWIKDLLEPKIDWKSKLNRFMTEGIPFDFSFRKPPLLLVKTRLAPSNSRFQQLANALKDLRPHWVLRHTAESERQDTSELC